MKPIIDFLDAQSIWLFLPFLLIGAGGLLMRIISAARRKTVKGAESRGRLSNVFKTVIILLCFLISFGLAMMNENFRSVILGWLSSKEIYSSLIWSLIAFTIVLLLSRLVRAALVRGAVDIQGKHKIRRTIQWMSYIVFGISLIFIWSSHLQAFGVFLGMFAAGLALSLQETLLCLAGWLLIIIKKPFDIGDRIQINEVKGDVIDIQTFHTHVLEVGNWVDGDQSTGRIIAIPNSSVYRGEVTNYTKGFPFIWNDLKTIVTFDSDWELAKEIILEQAMEEAEKIESEVGRQIDSMQREYAIRFQKLTPIVYTKIEDIGVSLTLRYLTPVRNRRKTTHQISECILAEFAKNDRIQFAYPTQTIFTNPLLIQQQTELRGKRHGS